MITIDGKIHRSSRNRPNGKAALHLISVWVTDSRLVLDQVTVDHKSNEITPIPDVLDLLDLGE